MDAVTEHRSIVDTHRHPIGPKLAAKMAARGLYDAKKEFPQSKVEDLICYREFFDLEYAIPKQREGGVTEANDIVVHIHPLMLSIGHEVLMQYRLNEAVGRPFDSTVNSARMIGSGLFDRHPSCRC